jgi:hypothetical protein
MFARLSTFLTLFFLVFPTQAQDFYRTYRNARFGTLVQYPASLLVPQPESDNGDGRRFVSRDEQIELSTFAFFNIKQRTSSGEMNRAIRDWRRDGARITYQKAGSDWFVLSGYVGDDIFYEKTLLRGSVFHSLIWQYPKTLRRRLDAPVTRSVRTFGAAASLETPRAAATAPRPIPTATPRPTRNRPRSSIRPAPTRGY